jgi:hypothetical protein
MLLLDVAQAAADIPDAIFGRAGFATRFAWTGAILSAVLWIFSIIRIWHRESNPHHLVARITSGIAMIIADFVIIVIFWPPNSVLPFISLNGDQARAVVAVFVGAQCMSALYQVTAPRRPQDTNRSLPIIGRWQRRSMRRRPTRLRGPGR